MERVFQFRIELPEDASADALRRAGEAAREMAVLSLQQEGELTIREAALQLGLTYERYLDLLSERGLPATSTDSDPAVLDLLRREVRRPVGSSR